MTTSSGVVLGEDQPTQPIASEYLYMNYETDMNKIQK